MRYWRCRVPRVLEVVFWPLFGHLIRINMTVAYCERCPWSEPLPWHEWDVRPSLVGRERP